MPSYAIVIVDACHYWWLLSLIIIITYWLKNIAIKSFLIIAVLDDDDDDDDDDVDVGISQSWTEDEEDLDSLWFSGVFNFDLLGSWGWTMPHCGLCHLWTSSDRKVFCWEENLQNASGRYLHSMSVGLSRLPMEESRHAKEVRRRMMHHHSYLEFFVCALLDRWLTHTRFHELTEAPLATFTENLVQCSQTLILACSAEQELKAVIEHSKQMLLCLCRTGTAEAAFGVDTFQ